MSRISIILPVYNGEAFLAECLNSVFAQTLEDFELLVGDDASSDASRAILERCKDHRATIVFNERNVGLFANLNRLVARATAPLIRFLCQDDTLEPQCLAADVAYFEASENVVMAINSVHEMDADGKVTGAWPEGAAVDLFEPSLCLQKLFYRGCIAGSLSTVAVRRAHLNVAGRFNESYEVAGDYEMWVRLCQQGCVAERHIRLVRLRRHTKQLSEAPFSGVKFVRENQRVIEEIVPLLPEAIRTRAEHYSRWRHNVFDANYLVHCLLARRFAESREAMAVMGPVRTTRGLMAWLLTLNNHLYRPKPVFSRDSFIAPRSPSARER